MQAGRGEKVVALKFTSNFSHVFMTQNPAGSPLSIKVGTITNTGQTNSKSYYTSLGGFAVLMWDSFPKSLTSLSSLQPLLCVTSTHLVEMKKYKQEAKSEHLKNLRHGLPK